MSIHHKNINESSGFTDKANIYKHLPFAPILATTAVRPLSPTAKPHPQKQFATHRCRPPTTTDYRAPNHQPRTPGQTNCVSKTVRKHSAQRNSSNNPVAVQQVFPCVLKHQVADPGAVRSFGQVCVHQSDDVWMLHKTKQNDFLSQTGIGSCMRALSLNGKGGRFAIGGCVCMRVGFGCVGPRETSTAGKLI